MSWIGESLIRHCGKRSYYCEIDEIFIQSVTEESKKEFYRHKMAELFKEYLIQLDLFGEGYHLLK